MKKAKGSEYAPRDKPKKRPGTTKNLKTKMRNVKKIKINTSVKVGSLERF